MWSHPFNFSLFNVTWTDLLNGNVLSICTQLWIYIFLRRSFFAFFYLHRDLALGGAIIDILFWNDLMVREARTWYWCVWGLFSYCLIYSIFFVVTCQLQIPKRCQTIQLNRVHPSENLQRLFEISMILDSICSFLVYWPLVVHCKHPCVSCARFKVINFLCSFDMHLLHIFHLFIYITRQTTTVRLCPYFNVPTQPSIDSYNDRMNGSGRNDSTEGFEVFPLFYSV